MTMHNSSSEQNQESFISISNISDTEKRKLNNVQEKLHGSCSSSTYIVSNDFVQFCKGNTVHCIDVVGKSKI